MTITQDPVRVSAMLPLLTAEMARAVAETNGVCVRPVMRQVLDRQLGTETRVAIRCGATRAASASVRGEPEGCGSSSAPKAGTATPNPSLPTL